MDRTFIHIVAAGVCGGQGLPASTWPPRRCAGQTSRGAWLHLAEKLPPGLGCRRTAFAPTVSPRPLVAGPDGQVFLGWGMVAAIQSLDAVHRRRTAEMSHGGRLFYWKQIPCAVVLYRRALRMTTPRA